MRIFTIIIVLMLLGVFGIGIALSDSVEYEIAESAFDNASITISNITLDRGNESIGNVSIEPFYRILEEYIQFVGVFAFELTKFGVKFGYENPNYFTPENIINVMRLIIWAILISLLIKPLFYLVVFLIMIVIAIKDKIKEKKT